MPDQSWIETLISRASIPIAGTLVLYPFLIAIDTNYILLSLLGFDELLFIGLGMALCLMFWGHSNVGMKRQPGYFDAILGCIALLTGIWGGLRYESFAYGFTDHPAEPIVISLILLVMTLECCRRFSGLPMVLLVSTFLIFGYVAQFLPGSVSAPPISVTHYLNYVVIEGDALLGRALRIIIEVVIVFALFGKMFEMAGGTEFIKNFALRFTAGSKGAPIKVSIVASGLIGSIIGSTTSNILTSGSFSIPLMRKIGMKPHEAAGVEAVASTGGQLTPPVMGLAVFLMVELTGLSYSTILASALLPSLLFYFSLFVQADRYGVANELTSPDDIELVSKMQICKQSLPFVISLGVLIACLSLYSYAPQFGAAVGVIVAVTIAMIAKPGDLKLFAHIVAAGKSIAGIVVIAASVGIIIGVVNSTGLGVTFVLAISEIASHSLFLALIIAAIASYILGIGLATMAVYVVAGTLIAPSLVDLGLEPIVAHMFVLYTAMLSMITPPVAIGCLISSGMANASFMRTSVFATKFGWLKFLLPFLFVYSPELLMIGSFPEIAGRLAVVMVGILMFVNASSGYDMHKISPLRRVFCFIFAVLLLLPVISIWFALPLAGIALLVLHRGNLTMHIQDLFLKKNTL